MIRITVARHRGTRAAKPKKGTGEAGETRGERQRNPRKAAEKPEGTEENDKETRGRQRGSRRDPRTTTKKPDKGNGGAGGTRGGRRRNPRKGTEKPEGAGKGAEDDRGNNRKKQEDNGKGAGGGPRNNQGKPEDDEKEAEEDRGTSKEGQRTTAKEPRRTEKQPEKAGGAQGSRGGAEPGEEKSRERSKEPDKEWSRAGRRAGQKAKPGGEQRPKTRPRCAGGSGGRRWPGGEDKRGKGGVLIMWGIEEERAAGKKIKIEGERNEDFAKFRNVAKIRFHEKGGEKGRKTESLIDGVKRDDQTASRSESSSIALGRATMRPTMWHCSGLHCNPEDESSQADDACRLTRMGNIQHHSMFKTPNKEISTRHIQAVEDSITHFLNQHNQ